MQAAGTIPGTAGDPLVAQSYVEKVVRETVADLQNKLDDMEVKVAVLEEKIGDLSGNTGKSSSKSTTSRNAGSNTSNNTGSNSGSNSNKNTKETDNPSVQEISRCQRNYC